MSTQCQLEAQIPEPACRARVAPRIGNVHQNPEGRSQSLFWHHEQDNIQCIKKDRQQERSASPTGSRLVLSWTRLGCLVSPNGHIAGLLRWTDSRMRWTWDPGGTQQRDLHLQCRGIDSMSASLHHARATVRCRRHRLVALTRPDSCYSGEERTGRQPPRTLDQYASPTP